MFLVRNATIGRLEDPKGTPIENVPGIRDEMRGRVQALIEREAWGGFEWLTFGRRVISLARVPAGREPDATRMLIAVNNL